jgi:hypothetical protein
METLKADQAHPTLPSRGTLYLPCGRYGFRISEIWVSQKNKVPLFLLKNRQKNMALFEKKTTFAV